MASVGGAAAAVLLVAAFAVSCPPGGGSPRTGDSNGWLVFDRDVYGLWLIDARGHHLHRFLPGDGAPPRWSPNGTRIAFFRGQQLMVVNADGTHLRKLGTRADCWDSESPGRDYLGPSWSPDGSALVYAAYCDDSGLEVPRSEIRLVRVADGTEVTLARMRGHAEISRQPWSPDGRRIVFAQGPWLQHPDGAPHAGYDFELFTINADGHGLRQLTEVIGEARSAAWAPEGTAIAFAHDDRLESMASLEVISPDGGTPAQIVKGTSIAEHPLWSPNGRRILFDRTDARHHSYSLNLVSANGSGELEVSPDTGDMARATWSPDSRTIMIGFLRCDLTADDAVCHRIANQQLYAGSIDWQPTQGTHGGRG